MILNFLRHGLQASPFVNVCMKYASDYWSDEPYIERSDGTIVEKNMPLWMAAVCVSGVVRLSYEGGQQLRDDPAVLVRATTSKVQSLVVTVYFAPAGILPWALEQWRQRDLTQRSITVFCAVWDQIQPPLEASAYRTLDSGEAMYADVSHKVVRASQLIVDIMNFLGPAFIRDVGKGSSLVSQTVMQLVGTAWRGVVFTHGRLESNGVLGEAARIYFLPAGILPWAAERWQNRAAITGAIQDIVRPILVDSETLEAFRLEIKIITRVAIFSMSLFALLILGSGFYAMSALVASNFEAALLPIASVLLSGVLIHDMWKLKALATTTDSLYAETISNDGIACRRSIREAQRVFRIVAGTTWLSYVPILHDIMYVSRELFAARYFDPFIEEGNAVVRTPVIEEDTVSETSSEVDNPSGPRAGEEEDTVSETSPEVDNPSGPRAGEEEDSVVPAESRQPGRIGRMIAYVVINHPSQFYQFIDRVNSLRLAIQHHFTSLEGTDRAFLEGLGLDVVGLEKGAKLATIALLALGIITTTIAGIFAKITCVAVVQGSLTGAVLSLISALFFGIIAYDVVKVARVMGLAVVLHLQGIRKNQRLTQIPIAIHDIGSKITSLAAVLITAHVPHVKRGLLEIADCTNKGLRNFTLGIMSLNEFDETI